MDKLAAQHFPEQTIGYDARDYGDDFSLLWPERRIKQFLYRLDVRKVLSVDSMVWPSVFANLLKPAPSHQESVQDLWASESTLREALAVSSKSVKPPALRVAAITLVWDDNESRHPLAHQLASFVEAPSSENEWQFVGFDVADALLLSALSNCGFLHGYDDAEALRREWGPQLNEYHLFSDVSAAAAFRRMSDIRLADDHAPTFIYGLHVLRLCQ